MFVELWTSRAFVEEARGWVEEQLRPLGTDLTGDWEQPHAREWSSAISFETTDGRVWFKVNGVGTAHEAGLVRELGRLVPGLVPEVLAVDAERAWTLSRDAGPTMRSVLSAEKSWEPWERLLARYAEAQLQLAEHAGVLLATGTPHLGPSQLVTQFHRLATTLGLLPVDEGGLSDEQRSALESRAPAYEAWCRELDATPFGDTVQHDDLHSNNVCWSGDAAGARFIDWGDATVSHPFLTLLATLNSVAFHAGVLGEDLSFGDDRVLRVRDAYLEPFTAFADRADLLRWSHIARRVGCVSRAMAYEAALSPQAQAADDFPVREWLLGLTEEWATAPLD